MRVFLGFFSFNVVFHAGMPEQLPEVLHEGAELGLGE